MQTFLAITLIYLAGMLVGAVVGWSIAYLRYKPKTTDKEDE